MVDALNRSTVWPWLTLTQGYRYNALLRKYRRVTYNAALAEYAARNGGTTGTVGPFGTFYARFEANAPTQRRNLQWRGHTYRVRWEPWPSNACVVYGYGTITVG